MNEHVLTILKPAEATPATILPDGAITGNGDVAVILAGSADRVHLYIGKADFWKADGIAFQNTSLRGGTLPLGLFELLLPQLAYAEYKAVQNLDKAHIELHLKDGKLSADMKVTVCAEKNTILIELDRTFPAVSVSASLLPLEGLEAAAYTGEIKDVKYAVRSFDTPELRFPTSGICALRTISRSIANGKEHIVWAITVCTNHDSAAYKHQAVEKVIDIDEKTTARLLRAHEDWWKNFWSKSSVELPDEKLELYWYAGLYSIACCARNKKFPPGLWGAYSTSAGMGWFGDYHLNYNYEAPFYALTSSNHPELIECYTSPFNDFLPTARQYAKEYLGIDGSFFPVCIGPLGFETTIRPDSKEHGHMFLGQKSNGAYAAVIPMMHWYGTRDTEFAKREYYDFLLSVADFWENYLVFEDGAYQIYNDALNEVGWYAGPNSMPKGHDDKNPVVSKGLVRMLMKLMIDLSSTLGIDTDRIPKWQYILDHLPEADTFESSGEMIMRGIEGSTKLLELTLEYTYPAGQVGKYSTPELYIAAKNTHKRLGIWDSHNRFCSYYPMAARLEYPADEIITHIHEVIEKHGLPNGMIRYGGGGIENSTGVPATVNEMLLQSYEGIVRLFPVWDKSRDARFRGLRANGAFLVDASLENGAIKAEILSEQGMPLTLEVPEGGYTLTRGDGKSIFVSEGLYTVDTTKGEHISIISDKVTP